MILISTLIGYLIGKIISTGYIEYRDTNIRENILIDNYYIHTSNDPFDETPIDTIKVIAIKGDYVKYGFIKSDSIVFEDTAPLTVFNDYISKRINK